MPLHRHAAADHRVCESGQTAVFALHPISIAVTVALLSFNPGLTSSAVAAPTGGQVAAGAATIQQPTAQSTIVNQATPRAVLNWQSFGIGAGESVVFKQPTSSAVALNRVVGPDASVISGTLQANGHVFLVNPSGVLFSKGASVDVGGLVASTLAISNADFMSGQYVFSGGAGSGAVVNEGSIRAADGGYVALIGNQVSNSGTIVANAGSVALGAGDTMLLDFGGDGLLNLRVNTAAAAARIDHGGVIQADGGRVIMSAQAKNALTATAVNVDGIVRARGIEQRNGEIFLDGGRSGVTSVSGTLDASSANAGQKGGEIRVLGEYVGLFGNADVNASGAGGGGTVLVGGDFQGKNADIANAGRTYVGPDAALKADAITSGNGGKVIVWADDTTRFLGSISARGGAAGGNGGFAEVSGKGSLVFSGTADVGANAGRSGSVLLDPDNIVIAAAGGGNPGDNALVADGTLAFAEGAATSTIDENTLEALTGNIVLQATQDITNNAVLDLTNQTAGERVVMQAGRHVTINAGIRTTGAAIVLEADSPHSTAGAADGTGTLTINANLFSNQNGAPGGDISLIGADFAIGPAIAAGAGRISIAPSVNGTAMVLGSGTLNSSEIFQFNGSGVAAIGRATSAGSDGFGAGAQTLTAGSISIDAPLSGPSAGSFSLISSGGISQSAGSTLTTNGPLAVTAAGNVSLPEANNVATFAASVTAGNSLAFNDANAFTIGSVDGITGVNAGGAVSLQAGGALTVSSPITNTGATTLVSGANITGTATISGADVTLDSVTGVGASGARVNTAATALAARSTSTTAGAGGVFVQEADAVTLNTLGGVANGSASNMPFDISAAGAITVAGTVANTSTGAVTLTASGINLNADVTTDGGSITVNGPLVTSGASPGLISNVAGGSSITAGNIQVGTVSGTSLVVSARGEDDTASVDDGTVVLGTTMLTGNLFVAGRTVQIGAGSNIGALAANVVEPGAAFSYTDADAFSVSTGIGGGNLPRAIGGVSTNNGAIALATQAGNLSVTSRPIDSGTATVSLTAGGSGNALILSGSTAVTGTSGVTLTADRIEMPNTSTVNAGAATATLRPFTAGTLIDLGSTTDAAPNTLELADSELDKITAGTLVIGASAAGAITVSQPISAPAGWNTLSLRTGASVIDGNGAAGADITVANLAIRSVSGIGTGNPLETAVTNLAFSNIGAGGVAIANTGALTVGSVDGINALNTGSGTLALSAASPVTIAADIIQTASINLTAGEDAAPGAGDDLTVNTGVTIRSTAGDVTLRAGDQITLAGTALAESTAGGGSVTLVSGFNDNDGAGAITGTGRASAVNVVLDSLAGVGASGARFNTTAGTLAARSTASGGVFVNEADAVTLNTIGAVPNAGAGSGYDLLAAGAISVAAPVITTAAGPLALNGAAVNLGANLTTAGGTIAITGPVTLTANNLTVDSTNAGVVPAGANIALSGAVNADAAANNRTLAVNAGAATATFSGNVGAGQALADFDVTAGSVVFNAAAAQTIAVGAGAGNTATLTGPVTLAQALTVESGVNNLNFTGAIDGAFALTVNGSGATTFGGPVGGALALSSVTTGAGGTTAINGGGVTTTGAQTYNDAVILGADTTLVSSGGGAITTAGALDGAFNFAANTSGITTLGGAVGGTTALASLTTDALGSTAINGGSIVTTGAQTYNDAIALGANAALSSTGGGNIAFAAAIDGGFALAANTTGTTSFAAPVGANAALAALNTDAGGTTALNGGSIITSGAQNYGDAVTLGANAALTSTGAAVIAFGSTLNGGFALAANTAGTTTFAGAVGGTVALASVTTDAGGTTAINGGGVTTTGAQTYNDAVILGADTTLTSSGGGAITAAGALDGAFNFAANTSGITTLGGAVGGTTALTSLTTDAAGSTAINGGSIVTTGAQTYNDAATLGANAALTSSGAGNIAFVGALDGAFALSANTAGATTFAAPTGTTTALAALSTDAPGTTVLSGGTVNTTGAQSYGDAVTLAANTTLASTGGGAITFGNTVDGAATLAANTAGLTSFSGAVGANTALVSLSTDSPGSTALNGGAVTTTAAQTYNDAVVLGANTALSSTAGGALTLAAVDGGFALAANTAGTTTLGGPVGANAALASLATDAAGTTALNAAAVTTSGNQTYNDSVALGANPTLTSTSGNVAFASTIDADAAANNRALTVNASAGTVTFSGNIGANQALADLDVSAGPTTIVFNGAPSQTVNVSAQGGNTATFNGPVVLATNLTVNSDGATDNNVTFASTVNADAFANNRTLTVTSGTASTTFGGAIGNTQELGALSVSAGQLALGGNVSVTGGGAVDLANVPSIAFASGVTIDTDRAGGASAAGNVVFDAASFTNTAAANASFAIDASADSGGAAGDVTLGTIGNANRLDTLGIVGDSVTFAGPVSARQVLVTANTVVTPTGRINASQGFNNNSSNANAALLLRGLSGPGLFGTRDAPIQIDAPGLFVVVPSTPNTLPFVFLAGDPNKSPVYQFANDPSHRRVFYNGAAPDSPADRAAQGAITQQLRTLLDELAMAGFAKENIRKQLLQGIVLETGLARPGIDEFKGEGVTAPPSCEPEPDKAAKGALIC